MTDNTFHCLCGFASDDPGACPTCGDQLYPKRPLTKSPEHKSKEETK